MASLSSVSNSYFALFAIALIATLLLTPLASKIAWKLDAVDHPNRRRVNTTPTPRMGGIAVMAGLAVAFGGWLILSQAFGWGPIQEPTAERSINYVGVGLSIFGMFLVGAIDDVKNMMPHTKFIWQVVAASAATAFGVVIGSIISPIDDSVIELGWIAYPITVIYLVSFANIINLIDGIDGEVAQ